MSQPLFIEFRERMRYGAWTPLNKLAEFAARYAVGTTVNDKQRFEMRGQICRNYRIAIDGFDQRELPAH